MDVTDLNSMVLLAAFTAIFFYILYCVVRAAVRRGIIDAHEYLGSDRESDADENQRKS
ncbi:hypothetical protein [Glutamicibacter uratoxydans]|uniref:hypothetical protein n=1 Tax=Glutamicibacter uratoxydans TaxID=43667 RepID=UPI0014774E54|nr:hypothetical protein [Glutamicibacter uratoxydans]